MGAGLSFRTRVIWGALAASMVVVTGGLSLVGGSGASPAGGRLLTPLAQVEGNGGAMEFALRTNAELDRERWTSIVIHHSGSPADTPEELDGQHRRAGLASLGYHFVIGDGARMGDGDIHSGSRWLEQQPGAHVAGREGHKYNASSIGICLVGNGDRRVPTAAQLRSLVGLVSDLARSLDIPREQILLHSDLAPTTSPGRMFPASLFYEQIAWLD